MSISLCINMNCKKAQILLTLSLVILNASVMAQSSVVAKGSAPVLVSSDFLFTEGPAVDREGNIYFTDQPNDKIMKWSDRWQPFCFYGRDWTIERIIL